MARGSQLRRGIFIWALAAACGGRRPAAADELKTTGPLVTLPTYVVTDTRRLPRAEAWRYARLPGFEVLSSASDRTSVRLLADLQKYRRAVSVVWPTLQSQAEVPALLILCGRGNRFAEFTPAAGAGGRDEGTASLALRDREQAAIVIDLESEAHPVLALDDGPATAAGVATDGVEVDFYKELHREYVHFLLSRVTPRPPTWLEEGLAQLLTSMSYTNTRITFGKLQEPGQLTAAQAAVARMNAAAGADGGPAMTAPAGERDFNEALATAYLMPLGRMFAVARGSPEAVNTVQNLWAKQCWEFVHLCLYGEHQKYLKGFMTFVGRLHREPPSEELFKACFGVSSRSMLLTMRGYAQFTVYQSFEFRTPPGKPLPAVAPPAMRDATEAEVGRIKGDTLRMAGRNAEAHYSLIAPYLRGSRDPDLLAALGLEERAAGADARAEVLLAAAAAGKTNRARAYLELARLHAAEAAARPAGPNRQYSTAQVASILEPLFTARRLRPPLPEVYEEIAAAWTHSALAPTAANLEVVSEGARLFPGDTALADARRRLGMVK